MWIRIVDIDRASSAISLVVAPENAEESFAEMDAFVSKCRARGFGDVQLSYKLEAPKAVVRRLKDYCSANHLKTPEYIWSVPNPHKDILDLWSCQEPHTPAGITDIEYQMSVNDLATATTDLDTAIMLIGESLDVDPRGHFRLRLCAYELATNTIEHGNFKTNSPTICIRFVFSRNQVEGFYADNASVFVNKSTANVNLVEEQIKSRSKRGLGLYMMSGICNDWHYERVGAWNVTKFSLDIQRVKTVLKER